MDEKETIKILKETKDNPSKHISQWGEAELTINPLLDEALSEAIKILKLFDSIEGLPEKKSLKLNGAQIVDKNAEGFNEMRDIAKVLLEKQLSRIKELEKAHLEVSYEIIAKDKELQVLKETYKNIESEGGAR